MSSLSTELFYQGCEASPPLQVRITPRGDRPPSEGFLLWEGSSPFAVVGSGEGVDLKLHGDSRISPRHCYLQVLGPRVLAIDLGSKLGLFSREGPCQAGWIDENRGLSVGKYHLSLAAHTSPHPRRTGPSWLTTSRLEDPRDSHRLPRIVLDIQAQRLATSWVMSRAIVLVGSAEGCALRLCGPGISPYHAVILRTNTGLWVVDLLGHLHADGPSIRPLTFNGQTVRFGCLGAGDRLEIGDFRIGLRDRNLRPRPLTEALSAKGSTPALRSETGTRSTSLAECSTGSPYGRAIDATRDAGTYHDNLIQLIDLQQSEINSLKRDVVELRNQLRQMQRAALPANEAPRFPIPEERTTQRPLPPDDRRLPGRLLGTAIRRPDPSLHAAVPPLLHPSPVIGSANTGNIDLSLLG